MLLPAIYPQRIYNAQTLAFHTPPEPKSKLQMTMTKSLYIRNTLALLASSSILFGCIPTTAIIADLSPSKAVIASNSDADDEEGTIWKKAQESCNISNPGSTAIPLSYRCGSKSVSSYTVDGVVYTSSYCEEYHHLFACKD